MTLIFALSFAASWTSAHPGGDPPASPSDPWIDQQCDLPPDTDSAIDISYQVWYVGTLFADKPILVENFCNTVIGVQQVMSGNDLFLRLYPDGAADICDQVPSTTITNTATTNTINDFAQALHNGTINWQELNDFTVAAKDPPDPHYEDSKINIYVLDEDLLENFRGMHVRDVKAPTNDGIIKGNLIFVPFSATVGTVMHEFAHAFTLEHVNFWSLPRKGDQTVPNDVKEQKEYCAEYDYWDNECDFSQENVMWAAGTDRRKITTGQKERIVCNDWSALNTNGDRDGEVFKCPDWAHSDLLPSGVANKKKPCPPLHDGIYEPAR